MTTYARHQHTLTVLRGDGLPGYRATRRLRRHQRIHAALTCPTCNGHGTPDGCWWCGETPHDATEAHP